MNCNNCYNGCTETVSDKCIKYTGVDIPALGIETNDSLAVVEAAIFEFLVPMLTGEGIEPVIAPEVLCDLILDYLPSCTECTGFTLNELLTAIIQAVCSLQTQVTAVQAEVDIINASYTIDCLSGVDPTDGAHAILQAVINKLCSLDDAVGVLAIDLAANYVSIADVNDYIQAYIDSQSSRSLWNNRMVPNCPIPYVGSLSNFDITGAGIGDWINVYLCNGLNGTIDARGRAFVGATTMGSNAFPAATDPAISGNPTYSLGTTEGANQVALTTASQLPGHTHTATSLVTDPGHTHTVTGSNADNGDPGTFFNTAATQSNGNRTIASNTTGITVAITIASTGAGLGHANIQPSIATYFIIYIP